MTELKKFKIAVIALVAFLASVGAALAQSGLRNQPAGFCTSSTLSGATLLSAFTCNFVNGVTLPAVQYAVVCAYSQGVVWRDDGTAPTATPGTGGQGLAANQCMAYNGNFQNLQFIQQTATATVGVTLYK